MARAEEDQEFNCPYCMAVNSLRIDLTAGSSQSMVTDCEVCCRPIELEIDIDEENFINFTAKRQGEG